MYSGFNYLNEVEEVEPHSFVFHAVLHAFGEVWCSDGRGNEVLISKH